MNCRQSRELMPDYLTGELPADAFAELKAHMADCDKCRLHLDQMESAWKELGEMPDAEPGAHMRSRFYAMLEEEKRQLQQAGRKPLLKRFEERLSSLWPRRIVLQMATAALCLVIGLAAGHGFKNGSVADKDLLQLRSEVQQMRQMMSLSLLTQSTSSERLRGVNLSTGVERPSGALLASLTNTLESDPNVNVRLAAVDALAMFRDEPCVVDAAVQALAQESSPVVQIALIDFLIAIQEKQALEALKNFIQLKNVEPAVKEHAQESIREVM